MGSYYSIAQWGVAWLPGGLAVQAIGKRHQDEETDGPLLQSIFPDNVMIRNQFTS